jgi:hypothetical protein
MSAAPLYSDGPLSGPMSGQGIEVDMETGMPKELLKSEQAHRSLKRYEESLDAAVALAADLKTNSAVIIAVFRQYIQRLVQLARGDATCQALEKLVDEWRQDLELAPAAAEKQARKLMGPKLNELMGDKAAP